MDDPAKMMQFFFGPPSQDEQQRLAQIPVSAEEERQVGQEVVETYLADLQRQGVRVVSRGPDAEYLRDLVDIVRPQMRDPRRYPRIEVYVAQSPRCEARSFPGGTLVFYEGLLESCGNEAALVGIVGHELSHLDRGHHRWPIRRMKLARQMFSGQPRDLSIADFFGSGAAVLRTWTRPFQPEFEQEADLDGAAWAFRAGYDPRQMAELLRRLGESRPGVMLPSFLRSHPLPGQRHRAILQLNDQLRRTEPAENLIVGTDNWRRREAHRRRQLRPLPGVSREGADAGAQ